MEERLVSVLRHSAPPARGGSGCSFCCSESSDSSSGSSCCLRARPAHEVVMYKAHTAGARR